MDALLVDNRAALGDEPGLHALVVGISAYPHLNPLGQPPLPQHLGLTQISGPALSAWRLAKTLQAPPAGSRWPRPLKTLRLMVLPDQEDIAADPTLADHGTPEPTHANFATAAHAWRQDASEHRDGMTLLYFAGHGLQDGEGEDAMVLADFGAGPDSSFSGCARVMNVFNGMVASRMREDIALTQFFFVDSCRLRPTALDDFDIGPPPSVFALELRRTESRRAPIIFAAPSGTAAITRRGQLTFFAEAMLEALSVGATEPIPDPADPQRKLWCVTTVPLTEAIEMHQRSKGRLSPLYCAGAFKDVPLLMLGAPPPVDLEVRVTSPALAAAHDLVLEELPPGVASDTLQPVLPPPRTIRIPAGIRTWRLRDGTGNILKQDVNSFTFRSRVLDV